MASMTNDAINDKDYDNDNDKVMVCDAIED
jgi:hypothetical protein